MLAVQAFSATAFTVAGVVNKFGTVFINSTIWQYHASPAGRTLTAFVNAQALAFEARRAPSHVAIAVVVGIASMIVCILGGVAYQQSFKFD